jgi:hypothetical protein
VPAAIPAAGVGMYLFRPLDRRLRKVGYDESKPLARFLWDVFAGWDSIEGYRREDVVKKMIDAI